VNLTIERASSPEIAVFDAYTYEPPYDFYNGSDDPVQDPERYFAARDERGSLVGFFYYDERGDTVEIGLGLRPDLTGRGLGPGFLRSGIEFARDTFHARRIVLNVAAFNDRAITVYERAGFRRTGEHVRTFARWGEVPFVEMELAG
jgi:RimJ/RimL family protein N-acetyltransferase